MAAEALQRKCPGRLVEADLPASCIWLQRSQALRWNRTTSLLEATRDWPTVEGGDAHEFLASLASSPATSLAAPAAS